MCYNLIKMKLKNHVPKLNGMSWLLKMLTVKHKSQQLGILLEIRVSHFHILEEIFTAVQSYFFLTSQRSRLQTFLCGNFVFSFSLVQKLKYFFGFSVLFLLLTITSVLFCFVSDENEFFGFVQRDFSLTHFMFHGT